MSSRQTSIVLAALVLAGCGGGAAGDGAIRDAVMRSYTSTDARDCGRVFTAAFIRTAWGGVSGCRTHLRQLAKLPPRTVRVIAVHREGPVADARIRVDDNDMTVKLVLTGKQWQVDDTVGAQGSAKANLQRSRAAAAERAQADTPLPLGRSARFAEIAGVGPHTGFSVTVLRMVASGFARHGVRSGHAALTDDFGKVTNPRVRYRLVNVRVRVSNDGPAPFRGTFSGSVLGGGREWPVVRHVGRTPDWSDGETRGIAPGHSATRWLTAAIPASRRPTAVRLQPELLSGPATVAAVEPAQASWQAR